jgi:molybdopterin converting factor subunit 1
MTCTVLLFAAARDRAGSDSLTVELPSGATASELVSACVAAAPGLSSLAPSLRVAMDQALVGHDALVRDGAELALLPPVSGG